MAPAGGCANLESVTKTPVCVLGLGLIGGSVLRAAVASGREAFGYNRSAEGAQAARADGFAAGTDLIEALTWAADRRALIEEVKAQAVSYTTGVPPVVGAMMLFQGHWKGDGVFNVEQLPSKPFMDEIGNQGLPWHMREITEADQADLYGCHALCRFL